MTDAPTLTSQELHGSGVGRGAVVGPVARAYPPPPTPLDAEGPDSDAGRQAAVQQVAEAYQAVAATLMTRAQNAAGTTMGDVLTATAAMASDPELIGSVKERVLTGQAPLFAVDRATEEYVDLFTAAGGYLAERVTDLRSVRDRVLARIAGSPEPGVPELAEPSVVVATDLSPADTATLDLAKVKAIVIAQGGPTGHTAIIAGQLGIPCVVRVDGADDLVDGEVVAVDAATGVITRNPAPELATKAEQRMQALHDLEKDRSEGATADGHPVQLLANIGTAEDAERLTDAAVEGVGLFRTEVLFLGRTTAPSLQEQTEVYTRALAALGGRKVVVRTLDAGADKPLAFVTRTDEENPALGVRGYRLVRTAKELMADQLAALAAAQEATGVQPWVMAPMIATVDEAAEFAAMAREAGIAKAGVMVEVPSAALRARDILAEVDFVSMGTNDLAQYTMASDRLLGSLVDLLDPWQPAVLDLVAAVARGGREAEKSAGVCGESTSDPLMALVLAGLGVTSLSMSPAAVPAVRFSLARHSLERCQEMAAAALAAPTAAKGRAAVLALCDPQVAEVLAL